MLKGKVFIMINEAAYSLIYRNESAKQIVMGFAESNAFPNSIIISGKKGSGKQTFAKLIALNINCDTDKKPCMQCESCRKILKDISPDVYIISIPKDKKTIGIGVVRSIMETVFLAPNDLKTKVYIIKDADKMTEEAQNCLLKLFEEPPANVYFLLLCTSATDLLPTVRSRAPEIRTEIFGNDELKNLLLKNEKALELYHRDEESFNRAIHIAEGSYGEALNLIRMSNKKNMMVFSSVTDVVKGLYSLSKGEFVLMLIKEASDREEFARFIEFMIYSVRDMVGAKRTKENLELLFFSNTDEAKSMSSRFTLKKLLEICSVLNEAKENVSQKNVNLRTSAIVLADMLWKIK